MENPVIKYPALLGMAAAMALAGAPAWGNGGAPTSAPATGKDATAASASPTAAKGGRPEDKADMAAKPGTVDGEEHHHHIPSFEEFRQLLEEEVAFDCNANIRDTYQLHYPKCEHVVMTTGDAEQGKHCMEQAKELADKKVRFCEEAKKESVRLLKLPLPELRKQYEAAAKYAEEHPEIASDGDHHGHPQEVHP